MSEEEKQAAQYLLEWIRQGGLSQWIKYYLDAGDEVKLKEIKEIYDKIKVIFGF
jgi:hypothetical protein